MKILITTNQLARYGGSEMVALEIAEYFASRGNTVTIYTNYYGGLIKKDTSNQKYKTKFPTLIITDEYEIDIDADGIDIIWIQHQLIPPQILKTLSLCKEKRPYIVFNHMSSVVRLETPFLKQIEMKLADKIFAVSENTKSTINGFFESKQNIEVFPNPAPSPFARKPRVKYKKLKKVAIISNHPPLELLQARSKLRKKHIHVDIIGTRHKHVRVTPNLIRKYDCVVTIGKSVQYCMSMNVPVYVYDHFGGIGYIDKKNYLSASRHNFCGKDGTKKSADLIVHELVANHKKAFNFLRLNYRKFQKIYALDSRLEKLTGLRARNKSLTQKDIKTATESLLRVRNQHLTAEKRLIEKQRKRHIRHKAHLLRIKFPIIANLSNYLNSFLPQP